MLLSLSIASHPPPEEGGHPQGCNKNMASEDCFYSDFIRPDFQFDPVLQLKGQLGHKLVEYPTYLRVRGRPCCLDVCPRGEGHRDADAIWGDVFLIE